MTADEEDDIHGIRPQLAQKIKHLGIRVPLPLIQRVRHHHPAVLEHYQLACRGGTVTLSVVLWNELIEHRIKCDGAVAHLEPEADELHRGYVMARDAKATIERACLGDDIVCGDVVVVPASTYEASTITKHIKSMEDMCRVSTKVELIKWIKHMRQSKNKSARHGVDLGAA
jgi:hypothetical protein